jgi:hypothetical protein
MFKLAANFCRKLSVSEPEACHERKMPGLLMGPRRLKQLFGIKTVQQDSSEEVNSVVF